MSEDHIVTLGPEDLRILREKGMTEGRVRTLWIASTLEAALGRLDRGEAE
jgi:hypothetical protein